MTSRNSEIYSTTLSPVRTNNKDSNSNKNSNKNTNKNSNNDNESSTMND